MIDRDARNRVLTAIDNFLSGQTGAFDFDEQLHNTRKNLNDETVRTVVGLAWFHYDDVKDHKVRLTRQEWDFFQRLRLLLLSECEMSKVSRSYFAQWTAAQLILVAGLPIQFFLFWKFGLWSFALLTHFLFAAVFVANIWTSSRSSPEDKRRARYLPFETFAQLRFVRRSVPDFVKVRYPGGEEIRRPIRNRTSTFIMSVLGSFAWPLYAAVLFLLPRVAEPNKIILPATDLKYENAQALRP